MNRGGAVLIILCRAAFVLIRSRFGRTAPCVRCQSSRFLGGQGQGGSAHLAHRWATDGA